jgi:hypothetical protein
MQTKLRCVDLGEGADGFLKDLAAVFVILELVKAGTGGRKEDDVAGLGGFSGVFDGFF